ncbi:MAG: hypothetical protein MUD01_11585 [Chloroflexaceae bacterium]|jgi:hypothetical protein|nr:hypothetical protein [Chloroflexaceae bacterium]
MLVLTHTTPLEDIRNGIYFETRAEFAARLGITEQTYRRILVRDRAVENPTRRQVAARLRVAPHLIAELVPQATPERLSSITQAINEANAMSDWYVLAEDGSFTHAPDVQCPPGESN